MSLDVTGKNVRLWKNERSSKNGRTWNDYSIGVSKKKQSGGYVNGYIKVKFGRDVVVPDEIPNGAKMDFEGYISLDVYEDRNGQEVKKDMIMITRASFHDLYGDDDSRGNYTSTSDYGDIDSFEQAEDDIPF